MEYLLKNNKDVLDHILQYFYNSKFHIDINKIEEVCTDLVHDIPIDNDYYLDDIHIESVDEKTARVSLMFVSEFSGSHIFYENMYEIKEAK